MKPPKPQGMVSQVIRRESSSAGTRIVRLFEIAGLLLFVLGVAAPTRIMTWSLIATAAAMLSPAVWRIVRAKQYGPVGVVDPGSVVVRPDFSTAAFDVFPVTIATDVIRFANFEREFFPDLDDTDMWSREQYLEAFARYPKALTLAVARDNPRVVAGFDMWPLTKRSYQGLVKGTLREGNLTATDIATKPGECWYAGTIISDKRVRRAEPSLTPSVISAALNTWMLETSSVSDLRIVTVVWSDCGARLAQQLGFAKLGEGEPPQIWTLEGDRDSVIERLGNAFAVYQELRTQMRPAA